MKTLYLVRHAKSSWKYPDLDDFERPLNKRGRRNAPFMGRLLKTLKVTPHLVISSPANRAATTARIIADTIGYPLEKIQYNETIYGSSEYDLIHVIQQFDNAVSQAMLVSHNPAITDLANTIGDTNISNIPTCGVFCVNLNISSWAKFGDQRGELKFFEFPKKHTA